MGRPVINRYDEILITDEYLRTMDYRLGWFEHSQVFATQEAVKYGLTAQEEFYLNLQGRSLERHRRDDVVRDPPPPSRGPRHAKQMKRKLQRCKEENFRGHAHRFDMNQAYRRECEAIGYGLVWLYPDGELAEPGEPVITAEIEEEARILYGLNNPEHLLANSRADARRTGVRIL